MSLVLNVEILGEFKKLTQATKGAQGDLTGMGKTASKISAGIGKAFAAIGIGLSFKVIANELQEATKAAIEDRKSQELLALAMINTGKATDAHVKAAEASISKMQIQAGIADDRLRPSFQKLFIATGSVTESNRLMQIALDASAATGKDLDTVTQAMAKSLAGQDAALTKLIPSLRGSKTPIDDMAAAFKGASTEAANLDPYQRMQIIFGEIQEKLGTALLPILDKFAAWMMSPPGQKALQEIANAASNVLTELTKTANWAIKNKDWLLPLVAGVGIFTTTVKAIGTITTAINGITTAIGVMKAAAGTSLLAGLGIGAGIVGAGAAGSALGGYQQGLALAEQTRIYSGGARGDAAFDGFREAFGVPRVGTVPKAGTPAPGARGNVNITINTPKVNAQDIVNTINNATRTGYTGTLRSIKE
jgi:hypothetical protein